MENSPVWLKAVCGKGGLTISDDQLKVLEKYVALLLEWNSRVNLISRKDVENVWRNHILHCLSPLLKIRLPERIRMLDLGTGGGLPGIPLKIMNPSIRILMIDSTQKKITAVGNIVKELNLVDAHSRWGRAESLSREKTLQGHFDVVVARGVGPLDELIRLSHPFFDSHKPAVSLEDQRVLEYPSLLAYKGGDLENEMEKATRNKIVRRFEVLTLSAEGLDPAEGKKMVIAHFS